MKEKKDGRGGKRVGSGRKTIDVDKRKVQLYVFVPGVQVLTMAGLPVPTDLLSITEKEIEAARKIAQSSLQSHVESTTILPKSILT